MNNPSNQPEPKKTTTRIAWGTGHLDGKDAQAEVGLREKMRHALLIVHMGTPEQIFNEQLDNLVAAAKADKSAAVVEAEQSLLNQLNDELFFSTTQPDGQFIKDVIMAKLEAIDKKRYQPIAFLQPSTASDGESV